MTTTQPIRLKTLTVPAASSSIRSLTPTVFRWPKRPRCWVSRGPRFRYCPMNAQCYRRKWWSGSKKPLAFPWIRWRACRAVLIQRAHHRAGPIKFAYF